MISNTYSEVLDPNRFLYRPSHNPGPAMEVDTSLPVFSSMFSNIVAKNMPQLSAEKSHNNNSNSSSSNIDADRYMDNDMKPGLFAYVSGTTASQQTDEQAAGLSENENDDESVSSELDTSGAGAGKKCRKPKTPKKQSFTFSDCKICNDKATGVHYGISTCEGCKGFFKRNIQRNVYYQCFFGQNCKITPRTRNRCKACRLKRCIEVGMSFDGIKMGRIPKEVKKQALQSKLLNEQDSVGGERGNQHQQKQQLAMQGVMHNERQISVAMRKENYAGLVEDKATTNMYGYSMPPIKNSTNSTSSGSITSSDSNSSNCNELQGSFSINMSIKSNEQPDSNTAESNDANNKLDENNNHNSATTNNFASSIITSTDCKSVTTNASQTMNIGNNVVELSIDNGNDEDEDFLDTSETATTTSAYSTTESSTVSLRSHSINIARDTLHLVSSQDMKELCLEQFLKSVNSGNKAARSSNKVSEGTSQQQKLFASMAHQDEQLRLNSTNNPKSTNLAFTNIVNNLSPFNLMNVNINTKFLDMYMSKTHYDPYFQVICSVLNDKIYQLYNEHLKKINVIFEKLQKCLKQRAIDGDNYVQDPDFTLHNGTLESIWNGLIESLPEYVQSTFYFCKEMPGINELTQNDFSAILNNKLFEMFIIIHSKYFIDGESYLRLSNDVHYSRYWMNKVKGVKKTQATFELAEMLNEANMTEKERALLLPLMMTTCECDEDYLTLKDLNEYYTRAILYEFDLNNRDESFIIKMSKIISKIKWCKQIEMEAD